MSSSRSILPNQNPNLSPQHPQAQRRRSSYDSYDHYATPGSGSHPSDTPGNDGSSRSGGPRARRDSNGIGGGDIQGKTTYAKRGKITIVACVPCRKRKTKVRHPITRYFHFVHWLRSGLDRSRPIECLGLSVSGSLLKFSPCLVTLCRRSF